MRDLENFLKIEGNQEQYFITLAKEGLYSGPQLAILARTLHLQTMFIFQENRLEIPVQFHSFKGTKEQWALVDSGAMENFMDPSTIKQLRLGTKKLTQPIPVKNIDGTNNWAGHIMEFLKLIITRRTKKVPTRFYITNLGRDWAILGYP